MRKTVFAIALICVMAMASCSENAKPGNDGNTSAPTTQNVAQSAELQSENTPNSEATVQSDAAEAHQVVYSAVETYKNSIGTLWVQAIVQIKNTGSTNLYLEASSLDIENADGKLVQTIPMCSVYPHVLQPGETALIAEQTTLDDDPGETQLKVIPHYDAKKAKVECIRLVTSEEQLKDDEYGGLKMIGRVENNTQEEQKLVYVVANLYDADKNAIGQLFTILTNNLKPGEKVGFELTALSAPDSLTLDSVASFEVFAFPQQYQF